jgi:hypothetical protein
MNQHLIVVGDSSLIIRHMNNYITKVDGNLARFISRIRLEAQRLTLIEYYHVLSPLNQQANQLENDAMHLDRLEIIQIKGGIFTSPIP